MRIVMVEDDASQSTTLKRELQAALTSVEVTVVRSEREYLRNLPALAADPPDVTIIDAMLTYGDLEAVEDLLEDEASGFERAGLRCLREFGRALGGRAANVILYTVLGVEDIERDLEELNVPTNVSVWLIGKDCDAEEIIARIRKATSSQERSR